MFGFIRHVAQVTSLTWGPEQDRCLTEMVFSWAVLMIWLTLLKIFEENIFEIWYSIQSLSVYLSGDPSNRKCDYIWNAIYCILHKFLLSRGPDLPTNTINDSPTQRAEISDYRESILRCTESIIKMFHSNNNVCSQTANNISLWDWTLTVITKYVCTGHSQPRVLLTF